MHESCQVWFSGNYVYPLGEQVLQEKFPLCIYV